MSDHSRRDQSLRGRAVLLRAPLEADLPALTELRNDVDLQLELMARPRPNTPARVRRWIDERTHDPNAVFFVIADSRRDQVIGFVQVLGIDTISGTGKLGIALLPSRQGSGRGTEALRLLTGYLQGVLGLRKLLLEVLSDNVPAIALYKRTGFRRVGTLRRHFYRDGRYHDVVVMERFLEPRA